jgi:hypothetical protein
MRMIDKSTANVMILVTVCYQYNALLSKAADMCIYIYIYIREFRASKLTDAFNGLTVLNRRCLAVLPHRNTVNSYTVRRYTPALSLSLSLSIQLPKRHNAISRCSRVIKPPVSPRCQ